MYDQREKTISRSSILYGTREDDVWFNLDQFYKDQLQEVNGKLSQLDDEIWGKIVLMEKNRRIAKAYIRTPRFRIDGSGHEFDGQRIGFKSLRTSNDPNVEEIREKIGVLLLKMDQQGNILAKRCEGSSPVIVQGWDRSDVYCHGTDVTKSRGRLEHEKPARIFDMRLFKACIEGELRQPYPDRKRLLYKSCIRISLVKEEQHPFRTPCWFMLINLVALDMLNANVPAVFSSTNATPLSRCQSVSSDLQLAGKHLSVSSTDLYFPPALLASSASIYSDPRSPVWSESQDEAGASVDPTDRILSPQLANTLALGDVPYGALSRPPWSTALARSMDCLYSTIQNGNGRADDTGNMVQANDNSNGDNLTARVGSVDAHNGKKKHEQRKINGTGQNSQQSENRKDIYGVAGRKVSALSATFTNSDSELSSSSSQQQEIYEMSSTNSSNSSSGISCRPSSPSIISESISESHLANSIFKEKSSSIYDSHARSIATLNRRQGPVGLGNQFSAMAPEPPPRPRSLFKNAIRSKLFKLTLAKGNDDVLETRKAALARYNNVNLDDEEPSEDGLPNQPAVNYNTSTCGWRKPSPAKGSFPTSAFRVTSDSDSEIYRL